VSKFFVKRNN